MTPQVSVVMSVYNGAENLAGTLESVLRQEGCAFEFIVVNDGSTDASGSILDTWASRDRRMRVFHQENTGLTRALLLGCAAAQGRYIARQDAGDVSLPDRLRKLAGYLEAHPETVLVSGGTRFVGPRGEFLYEIVQDAKQAEEGLRTLNWRTVRGPSIHGCTMFRRDAYEAAGGYRSEFRVAQDLDLWLRLAERGRVAALPEVLYQALLLPDSISFQARGRQMATARIALRCAQCRRRGVDEHALLERAALASKPGFCFRALNRARAHYFLAACLRGNQPEAAYRYYVEALRHFPLYLPALRGTFFTRLKVER